jgi:hypothetical protein
MKIALYPDWETATHKAVDISFADFCARLGTENKPDPGDKVQTPAWAPAEYQPGKTRAKKYGKPFEKVAFVHALALDFDGPKKKGVEEAQVAALLQAFEGESFVVYSSYSHHTVAPEGRYKFRLVLELSRPITCAEHARLLAYVGTLLPVAFDEQCKDPTRIFGLPMMYHPCDFVQRYEGAPLDVDAMLALAPTTNTTATTGTNTTKTDMGSSATTPVLEATIDRKAAAKFATKLSNSKTPEAAAIGRLLKRVLDGAPYATAETERHGTARTLTMVLEREFPNALPGAIAALFKPSVVSMGADDPSWDSDQRLSDIVRLVEGAREKRIAAVAEAQAQAQVETQARKAAARPDKRPESYDVAEYEQLAIMAGCGRSEIDRHLIIVKDKSYYFATLDGYKGPYSAGEFTSASRDLLAPADVALEQAPQSSFGSGGGAGLGDGDWKLKPINEVLKDYGTAAVKILASMSAQQSTFDATGAILTEAVCKRRPLLSDWDPEFEKIDRYVGLFAGGGDQAERYKDWLATFPELERCTSALLLSGPKDTGKNLTFHGLARLWSTGGPTSLKDFVGNFNSAITNCPLVVSDERLPEKFTSADLREMTGSMGRSLTRKFAPTADLIGALRLIMIANRDDLLSFDEIMTVDELDATGVRVFHIATQKAAAEYLNVTPHRHWVSEDLFARYVLWLQKTRPVDRSGRWLVEGHMPQIRAKLATGGKMQGRMCEWLVGYLMEPQRLAATPVKELVQLRDGELYVNARAPCLQWGAYTSEAARSDTPTQVKSKDALKGLAKSHQALRVKNSVLNFWQIDLDNVLQWADDNGLGDVRVMRAAVEATRVKSDPV